MTIRSASRSLMRSMKLSSVSSFSNSRHELGRPLPIALPELDVSDPDVPDLMPALGRGPRQPRSRVLVYLGSDVVDEEGKPHADTSPSYRSVTDAPARSLSRRSWAPGTSSQRGRTHGA